MRFTRRVVKHTHRETEGIAYKEILEPMKGPVGINHSVVPHSESTVFDSFSGAVYMTLWIPGTIGRETFKPHRKPSQ